jgi:TonB family protein
MGRAALGLMIGTLLAGVAPADDAQFAARLTEARRAIQSGAGKEFYDGAFSRAFAAQLDRRTRRLKECSQRTGQVVSFNLLLKLTGDGRVEAAMVRPESRFAACYREQAKKDAFPRPPSAGFWLPVSLRFGKQEAVEVPMAPPARPTHLLIASLSSGDANVRAVAAWELAGATTLQAEARAALEPLQTDADRAVRYAARWALGHLPAPSGSVSASDETPPRPARIRRPEYPEAAFAAKIEGTVMVELLIGEQGEVAHLEVRRSIAELDAGAIACVRRWTFEPARVNGAPRATIAQAPVAFRIY